MLANKDGCIMAQGIIRRRWLLLTVGLFTLLCNICQAKRTICLPQPIKRDVTISMDAGNFRKHGTETKDMTECLRRACNSQKGNIAYLLQHTCFSVECDKLHLCKLEPVKNAGVETAGALYRIIAAYPEFKSVPRVVEVLEDTPLFKEVLRFEATAESRTKRTETMSFEIMSGNSHKTFRLFPKTSNWGSSIRLLKTLDRENISTYGLQIKATNTVENVSSLLNLSINVLDANDNPPEFLDSPFVFSVFSNMSVGTLIGRLVARDNDTGENSKLEYGVTLQSQLITYDKTTGEVRLAKKRRVDSVKKFDYDITATDGLYTTKGRLKIVLYPNNVNRPVFDKTSYEIRLNGQVPLNTEVFQLSATDPDYGKLGELTYVILDGDSDRVFQVTEDVIRTKDKIPTDSEVYNLTIGVHDNGYPELHAIKPANVVILLQWLRFKQYSYETAVPENLQLLDKVFTASASLWVGGIEVMAGQRKRAEGGINYYLEDGLERFEMEETSGVITLHKDLDYESEKLYKLHLKADHESADSTSRATVLSAKATLHVEVLDVNDNPPRFPQRHYTQDVWKSSTVNSPILRINATDPDEGRNGLVHFEAISGNFNDTFAFESDGMVFLKKSLLHSKQSTFNITVEAWDNGVPEPLRSEEYASVIINVRGYLLKAPKFDQDSYNFVISESVEIGFPIYQVNATVVDQRWKVTYWFRNLGEKIPFRVEPGTGWIHTTKRLDREEKAVYVLSYMASADLGRTSFTTMVNVTITLGDENDNRPIFPRAYYSTIINTTNKLGMSILKVQAVDRDEGENSRISYSITSKGHDKHYFSIDSRSGEISTKRLLPTTSLLVLKIFISARDHGNPPLPSLKPVPVFVLVNKKFPITVTTLKRTAATITLRFTMINVSLADISYIGIVVQAADSIPGCLLRDSVCFVRVHISTSQVHHHHESGQYSRNVSASKYFKRKFKNQSCFRNSKDLEITNRDIVSWHYVQNSPDNGAYAQRYLTGKVTCTKQMRKTKTFDFTVGSDGDQCTSNKEMFCNGKLQAEKNYRFQLVAYFKNGTSTRNGTSVESEITSPHKTDAQNAKQKAGFRSWNYDIVVIIIGVIVGAIIIVTITRAIVLYRRNRFRMNKDEAKGGISYPLSNPRYRRSGVNTPRSSRSTISFTELSKSRRLDKKMDKVSPCETEKLPITETDREGISRDSGCGVSVRSSNSDIHHRRKSAVRRAFFSFGKTKKDEEQQEEPEQDGSDKEAETELKT